MPLIFAPTAAPMSPRTFRCRDRDWQRAIVIAERAGVSTSEVVRVALERLLAEAWAQDTEVSDRA